MAEHTPTPWSLAHRNGQAAIRGPSTECLAVLPYAACEGYGLTDVFEVGANAAFIVKAVNSHDALVKALQKVRAYNVDIADGRMNYRPMDHIEVIDEALSGAERLG